LLLLLKFIKVWKQIFLFPHMYKSELINILSERGYLNQCTNLTALDELANREMIVAYIGFDCTARSLHVGNLISVMILRILQKTGHKPLVIMGGGTTKIGDPSGKDEQRKILTDEIIAENMQAISRVFAKFLSFDEGKNNAVMVNNADWLEGIKYIEFLRDIGKHFTINKMLTFDSVKLRLEREQPLSFLEFNYMLLQAYDFVELYRRYNCRLQCGGSDQWGNIVSGVDLGRRLGSDELYGLTTSLITTKSGKKMGKSENGAMWLDSELLSAYDYWQFWRNTEDDDVEKFLLLFTELPIAEVKKLAALSGREINEAKIILANEATKLLHGENAASEAMATAKKVFEQGSLGDDLPVYEINKEELEAGLPAYKLFAASGICTSGGEARRLIAGRGAKINNKLVESDAQLIDVKYLENGIIKLSAGQKKHLLVKVL
jgi:tyrosyl-tRNA synthetase